MPVLGLVAVGQDAELLHRVEADARVLGVIRSRIDVVEPIELEVVLVGTHAVDRDVAQASFARYTTLRCGRCDSRNQGHQGQITAAVQRNIVDLFVD